MTTHNSAMSMTLEQATQKILDKVLSLTDGWVELYESYKSLELTRLYSSTEFPDIMLAYKHISGHGSTAQILTNKGEFILTSEALLGHVGVIRESIARASLKANEESIIAIAKQINP